MEVFFVRSAGGQCGVTRIFLSRVLPINGSSGHDAVRDAERRRSAIERRHVLFDVLRAGVLCSLSRGGHCFGHAHMRLRAWVVAFYLSKAIHF